MLPHSLLLPARAHFFLFTILTLSELLFELIQLTKQEKKIVIFLLGLWDKSVHKQESEAEQNEARAGLRKRKQCLSATALTMANPVSGNLTGCLESYLHTLCSVPAVRSSELFMSFFFFFKPSIKFLSYQSTSRVMTV